MKVLVVASTFPASDTDPVPAFVKDQVIAMSSRYPDLKFTVLAPHDARSNTVSFRKHESYNEHRFHYIWPRRYEKLAGRGIMPQLTQNPLYYLLIPNLFIGEYFALKRLAKDIKPDIIYVHWFTPQGIVAGIVGKKLNIPVAITTHASDVAVWHKVPFGYKIVRRYAMRAARITAVSRRTMSKLKQFFTDEQWQTIKSKVKILAMGVNIHFEDTMDQQSTGENILFLGRLAEKKGVQYLIPAFANLKQKHPNAQLTIAGDGPMLGELKNMAKRAKIEVEFPGYVSGADKENLIKESDIYVVPSIITKSGDAEGMPVSLMEGLAAGKICVATNESGADDIITDGVDGFLVKERDVDGLCEALEKALVKEDNDKQILSSKARSLAKEFDWNVVAKKHYEFLFKGA